MRYILRRTETDKITDRSYSYCMNGKGLFILSGYVNGVKEFDTFEDVAEWLDCERNDPKYDGRLYAEYAVTFDICGVEDGIIKRCWSFNLGEEVQ